MPRIAEVNTICAELGKDKFLYEPEIVTQIQEDGRRVSMVRIRVFPDKDNKEVFSQLSCSVFSDTVYMKVKELYESLFDEDEHNDFDPNKVDESAFGFDLDSNNSVIGFFYIFLMPIYNLIDVKADRTPIIDNKGHIMGYVRYSLGF